MQNSEKILFGLKLFFTHNSTKTFCVRDGIIKNYRKKKKNVTN
jgi:hypothetical protein